jgi:hypothetical protein
MLCQHLDLIFGTLDQCLHEVIAVTERKKVVLGGRARNSSQGVKGKADFAMNPTLYTLGESAYVDVSQLVKRWNIRFPSL